MAARVVSLSFWIPHDTLRFQSFERPVSYLFSTAVFGVMLAAAAASDIRGRRVPNRLNLAILVGGLLLARPWPLSMGALAGGIGGLAVGMAIWFPMYLLRLVGAGDVKLLAASSVWLGASGAVAASIGTALAGGLLGLVWIVARQGVGPAILALSHALRAPSLLQLRPMDRRETVPYAVAIAIGVSLAWLRCTGPFFSAEGCRL